MAENTARDGTAVEHWSCTECGHEKESPFGELAGERFEKTIDPAGPREPMTVETVRCPECGSDSGWNSDSARRLVGTINKAASEVCPDD